MFDIIFYERGEFIKRYITHFIYAILFMYSSVFINSFLYIIRGINDLPFELLAPMVEESFRFFSVALGSPVNWLFTTIFAIHEYFVYIDRINIMTGYVPISLMLMRMSCIVVHFILLFIQLYGWKIYIRSSKIRYFYMSYFVAVVFHILWNTNYALKMFLVLNKIF